MHRQFQRKSGLLQAVLASTLFLAPCAQAVQINSPTNIPQVTSGDGEVRVLPAGQIDAIGAPAITVDSVGGKAIVDGGNLNLFTAVNSDSNPIIDVTANEGYVRIGAQSGITSSNIAISLIDVSGSFAHLINEGRLIADADGADIIEVSGNNVIIENALGALIQNNSGVNADPVVITGNNSQIINAGKIIHNPSGNNDSAIFITKSFSFTNNPGGIVEQADEDDPAFLYQGSNATTGIFINNKGATIRATDPNAVSAKAVYLQGNLETFYNAGVISSTKRDTLTFEDATIHSAINEGTLELTDPNNSQAVVVSLNAKFPNGFYNAGNIIAPPNGVTYAFVADSFAAMQIQQAGGLIRGRVGLTQNAGPFGNEVLVVTGGSIAGDVETSFNNQNIITVSGGSITGTVFNNFTGNILNLSGTGFVEEILTLTNGVVNISGGVVNHINGSLNNDSVNFLSSYVSNGKIEDLSNFNIVNAGTQLTLNGFVDDIDRFQINEGTTLIPNGYVGLIDIGVFNDGTVLVTNDSSVNGAPVFDHLSGSALWNNNGIVDISDKSIMVILGNGSPDVFTGSSGSSLIVHAFGPLGGPVTSGRLEVESTLGDEIVDLQTGSFLIPHFSGFMAPGSTFNVVTVNDGTDFDGYINDDSTLIQPNSAVVSFSRALVNRVVDNIIQGQSIQLTTHRNPYLSLTNGPATGAAGALDTLALGSGPSNNDLYTLLSQIDQLPTATQVSDAVASVAPPFNYGLLEASHIGMDSMFEGITDRVWDVAWHHREHGRRHHGIGKKKPVVKASKGKNHGDADGLSGIWLRPIGAYVEQSERDDVAGYKARAVGAALGFDWGVTDCSTLGLALSYTSVSVDDKSVAPKDERVKSWMGTAYGSFDFRHGLFMDAMVAGAHNDYHVNRVILANQLLTAAKASFDGSQWGVQGDVGMALPNLDMFLAPFVRMKYVNVSMDDYTETGAGGLNLHVQNSDAHEFLAGVGVRMAGVLQSPETQWVPELTALLGYDIENDGEVSLANFMGSQGTAFSTKGITPGRTVFDLGLGLNMMYTAHSVITMKYNLELRDDFVGNSAYVQYFYNWG